MNYPKVSVIMPALNEQKFIAKAITSLLDGNYPSSQIEMIVLDGGSHDKTVEIAKSLQSKFDSIVILHNEKKYQVNALNLGIKYSSGEIILRADAHSNYQSDYISRCVTNLYENDADNVGGKQYPVGYDYLTKGIALALNSRLGNGGATYRKSTHSKYTDTVFLGAWRKDTLIKVGGFDESFLINEDYELNIRIIASGGKILYDPKISTDYYVRKNFRLLAKQYFKYGYWKTLTFRKHRNSLKTRQLIIPIACISIIFSSIISLLSGDKAFSLPMTVYTTICALYSIKSNGVNGRIMYLPVIFITYPIIHFSWSLGFLYGLVKSPRKATQG